jgi:hypothetical protein
MAKDEFGHGSNGLGGMLKQHMASEASLFGGASTITRGSGEYPARSTSSDDAARAALMMGVKSGVVPIHDSMAGRASNPTTAPSPQNRRPGVGVSKGQQTKGERTLGQLANTNLVDRFRNA